MYEKKFQVKHAHTSTNGILINAKKKKYKLILSWLYTTLSGLKYPLIEYCWVIK